MSNGCSTIVDVASSGSMPFLSSAAKQLELVAAEPDADLLALHFAIESMPRVLPRDLGHARAGEHLRDVHQVAALFAGGEQARQPVEPELRLPAATTCSGTMSGPPA